MPSDLEPGLSHRDSDTRFLRRFAGPTRVASILTFVVFVPFMVMMPFVFARDGRLGWTVGSTLIALTTIALLITTTLIGYRIDAVGIASRQGFPPRFTNTMAWDDIAMITWSAGPIAGVADNCTVWCSGSARRVWARWLYEHQTPPVAVAEVRRHEAAHGRLTPMLVTLSSLSRKNRERLLATFEQQGFDPLPEHRRDYHSTVSRPAAHRESLG